MSNLKLISFGSNAKTVKGDGSQYLTAIMYLAPYKTVEGLNICPMAAVAKCHEGCLYTAGRARMFKSVNAARVRKTILYRDNRELFYEILRNDLYKFSNYCKKKDIQPVVRLNGTSDIAFYKKGIMNEFPGIQFYDYTKVYKRAFDVLPDNYHLTLSYSKASAKYALECLKAAAATAINLAVVFRDKAIIPSYYLGLPVINGDNNDLRFLDKPGHIVSLYAKGYAKTDNSGFVIG